MSESFARWFGQSRFLNECGHPQHFYHGTADDFTAFDLRHCGKVTDASDAAGAFWFSLRPERANRAAQDAAIVRNDRNDSAYEDGACVLPVFLRAERIKRFKGWVPDMEKATHQIETAKAQGFDAVLWETGERMGLSGYPSGPVCVVFSARQIKSVFNHGDWNPDSESLCDHPTEKRKRSMKPIF